MKNTVLAAPHNAPLVLRESGIVNRWGGIPLMAWMLIQGMPLGKTLEPVKPTLMEDVYARSLEATSGGTSLNSMLLVLLLGCIYAGAARMLLSKPRAAMLVLSRQWPVVALLLFVALSVLWTQSQEKVVMNILHNIGITLVTLVAALRYRNDPWLLPKHLGYVLSINIFIHVCAVALLPAFTIDWERRWLGLTGQANTLGALSLSAFWANSAALCSGKPDRYHAHLAGTALAIVAMFGANSVTSMISSTCLITVMILLSRPDLTNRIGRAVTISVLVAVPILAVLILFLVNAFDLGGILGLAGRSGDFSGRTSIWLDAIDLITMQPLVGWSFDDHAYVIRSTGMLHTSYHNGYLDLAVTGGIVGVALLVALLTTWMLEFRRHFRVALTIMPFSVPFVVALLIYNVTEASFVAPRNQLWVVFLTLVLLGACRQLTLREAPRTF